MLRVITSILLLLPLGLSEGQAFAETRAVDVVYPIVDERGRQLRLVGTVESDQHAEVASEQSGVVAEIFVEVGDIVVKGASLLRLDSSLAELSAAESRSRVNAAQVALAEAKRRLQEAESLSETQGVAVTTVEERRAQVALADAALAQEMATLAYRQKLVDKHTVRAPFSGVVEHREVALGEWLGQPSAPLRLVGNQVLRVRIQIPQEYYFYLDGGQAHAVSIRHDKLSAPLSGLHIDRFVAVSQQGSRSMPALIHLPAGSRLIPGMSVDVTLNLADAGTSSAWVPVGALKVHPDGGNSVIAVVDGKAKRQMVRVLERRNDAVLLENVAAAQALVASGVELIKDGMPLQIASTQEFAL